MAEMSKFIEVLESITGKRVIRPRMSVSHDDKIGKSELRRLADEMRKRKWHRVKRIKGGKRLTYLTTNDLNEQNELYPDYLQKREKRKKKEEKGDGPGWGKSDWR